MTGSVADTSIRIPVPHATIAGIRWRRTYLQHHDVNNRTHTNSDQPQKTAAAAVSHSPERPKQTWTRELMLWTPQRK